MTDAAHDRRGGDRIPIELEVDLHLREQRIPMRASDVSRHGMFLASKLIFPPLRRAVLVTVRLKSGPFETMANIVRRVEDYSQGPTLGIGLKIFCLGSGARERWDKFVFGLEHQPVALQPQLHRATTAAATFLVQPDDPAALLEIFKSNVLAQRVIYMAPAVRKIGAEVELVLVHPFTNDESVQRGRVVEWNPDHPQRMGVQLFSADASAKRAFKKFIGPVRGASVITGVPSGEGPAMVTGERASWTEYAFYSPKLHSAPPPPASGSQWNDTTIELLLEDEVPPSLPPQPPEELAIIEGELLQHPEFELVDKRALFDFNWNAEEK